MLIFLHIPKTAGFSTLKSIGQNKDSVSPLFPKPVHTMKKLGMKSKISCPMVFSHIPYGIDNFKKSGAKYLLATTHTQVTDNKDLTKEELKNGYGWRKIDLELPPYNLCRGKTYIAEPEWDRSMGLWKL